MVIMDIYSGYNDSLLTTLTFEDMESAEAYRSKFDKTRTRANYTSVCMPIHSLTVKDVEAIPYEYEVWLDSNGKIIDIQAMALETMPKEPGVLEDSISWDLIPRERNNDEDIHVIINVLARSVDEAIDLVKKWRASVDLKFELTVLVDRDLGTEDILYVEDVFTDEQPCRIASIEEREVTVIARTIKEAKQMALEAVQKAVGALREEEKCPCI